MNENTETQNPAGETPSKAKILKATAIALTVAAVLLVVAVLPAEYGIDPLGTGKALGLTALAPKDESETQAEVKPSPAPAKENEGVIFDENEKDVVLAENEPEKNEKAVRYIPQQAKYSTDSTEITLEPGEDIEYKFIIKKGDVMLYSWTANGPAYYDFHGEPKAGPADYFESYEKTTQEQSHGIFTAPFEGTHGWYWKNKTDKPFTIKLNASGYFLVKDKM